MAASIPNSLRAVKPFLIISNQLKTKNPVVSYYVKLYAIQEGLQTGKNDPEAKGYLFKVMDELGEMKKSLKGEEAISDETAGQAFVEEYALSLFDTADAKDRAADFSKSVSKAFFTASQLFVTLKQFGELSEDIEGKMKYAKWKAVEIDKCLKNGITPTPGPPGGFENPAPYTGPPADDFGQQPGNYGNQPGPSWDQPGPSLGYGGQPDPSIAQPRPPNTQPETIGFDLPPVPVHSEIPSQPQLPPEIKPVPKPRHDSHPTPPQPAFSYESPPPKVSGGYKPGSSETAKAQKYCKFASSAIEYEDIEGALEYLTKAISLLTTGKEN